MGLTSYFPIQWVSSNFSICLKSYGEPNQGCLHGRQFAFILLHKTRLGIEVFSKKKVHTRIWVYDDKYADIVVWIGVYVWHIALYWKQTLEANFDPSQSNWTSAESACFIGMWVAFLLWLLYLVNLLVSLPQNSFPVEQFSVKSSIDKMKSL